MLSVHDMLSKTARDLPHREALAWRGLRTSYAELDRAATRVARFLRSRGVAPSERVAICSPKCAAEVPLIFGIARAGCVLVHVNPAFRDEQVQHVVEETEPSALFFHASKRAGVERLGRARPRLSIRIGGKPDGPAPEAPSLDEIFAGAEPATPAGALGTSGDGDLAAILYTSGTTAKAKGILVTHRILSESTLVSAEVLGNVPGDRLISLTPFSFDGALSQLFTATLVGAALVLQESRFPRDVVKTMSSEEITGFHAVPSFWRMVLERYPAFAEHTFPRLRYLSLIGEAFPEGELARLKSILRTTDFFMMYGTTEAFRSTCLAPADFDRKRGSAGKPLPGVEIVIVDEAGRRCPAGELGEIVHRGAFVSPGYWRRDGGATFREDGVHTGDLGRLDSEGYLWVVGRKDTMIKRLGFRVYPEEVEASLATLDGVALATVVGTAGDDHGAGLRAFVVPAPGSGLTLQALVEHCRRHLPHYMQPDEIHLRDALPMTGTCKIDRARLSKETAP